MFELLQNGLYTRISYSSELTLHLGTVALMFGAALLCYLLGSLNTSIIASRLVFGDDVRRHGSGNAGLTNMLRTYGAKGAVLTLAGDILKTALSVVVGGLLLGLQYQGPFSVGFGGYLGVFFCMLGHTFPVYYRFKGGKGVLCAAVGLGILTPIVMGVSLLVFVIVVAFTRYISLGSIVSAAMDPLFLNVLFKVFYTSTPPAHVLLISFAAAAMIIWMHRSNIVRLWRGEENKFSIHRKKADPADSTGTADGEDDK